jgi:c-di-GMP-binding flagellar brake protein YcgR
MRSDIPIITYITSKHQEDQPLIKKHFKVFNEFTEYKSMEETDRRQYPRVDVYSSISYVCIDIDGNLIDQNMGVALNLSQSGILLETGRPIESNIVSLMFVDLEETLAEISGEVAYSKQKKSGMYFNGIHFKGNHEENIQFAEKLIRAYHYRKSDFVLVVGVNA